MKLVALLLLAGSGVAAAQTPIDIAHARTYFAELREIGRGDSGRLWGQAIDGPMIFADRNTRRVVANMPDSAGLLRDSGGVWVGKLPPDQNVANTSTKWAGRHWSMLMWPVSDNRYTRRRLLAHESFHRIQSTIGLPAADPSNAHLARADARIWMRLEWRALAEALLRTGPLRAVALRDALTFRARRHALFPPVAKEDERLLEMNEGLAEYTGLVLSGLPSSALYDRAAIQLAQYESQESFARSFAYASGPAYALLLDAAGKPWRRNLRSSSDLAALTASAYGIRKVEQSNADSLITRYLGERMIAEERSREAQRVAREARLRARFIDGPVLTLPVVSSFNFSFDPNGATPLPDIGTTYATARVTDEWGVLEVTSGGVLMKRPASVITGVVVTAPSADSPVKGDGWRLELAPGWIVKPGPRNGDFVVQKQ